MNSRGKSGMSEISFKQYRLTGNRTARDEIIKNLTCLTCSSFIEITITDSDEWLNSG